MNWLYCRPLFPDPLCQAIGLLLPGPQTFSRVTTLVALATSLAFCTPPCTNYVDKSVLYSLMLLTESQMSTYKGAALMIGLVSSEGTSRRPRLRC